MRDYQDWLNNDGKYPENERYYHDFEMIPNFLSLLYQTNDFETIGNVLIQYYFAPLGENQLTEIFLIIHQTMNNFIETKLYSDTYLTKNKIYEKILEEAVRYIPNSINLDPNILERIQVLMEELADNYYQYYFYLSNNR